MTTALGSVAVVPAGALLRRLTTHRSARADSEVSAAIVS